MLMSQNGANLKRFFDRRRGTRQRPVNGAAFAMARPARRGMQGMPEAQAIRDSRTGNP